MNTNPSSRRCGAFGVWALLLLIGLYACVTTRSPADERDPLERYDRAISQFNDTLDGALIKRVARGYRRVRWLERHEYGKSSH